MKRLLQVLLMFWYVAFQFALTLPSTGLAAEETADLNGAASQQSVGWITYPESDPRLQYSAGDWTYQTDVIGAEGSTLVVTSQAEATLNVTFEGTAIEVVYAMGSDGGSFDVVLLDENFQEVANRSGNSYATSDLYGQPLLFNNLTSGLYTLTLQNGDGTFWLDAVRVQGTLLGGEAEPATATPQPDEDEVDGWITYPDNTPELRYGNGQWTSATVAPAEGGTLTYTVEMGATLEASFTGTGIELIYSTGPEGGLITLVLDGAETKRVDTYSETYTYGHRIGWVELTDGDHTLLVINEQEAAWIEAVRVQGSLLSPAGYPAQPQDTTTFQHLLLTALCSPDPASYRVWRVRNSNPFPVNFTWDVLGSEQTGAGLISRAEGAAYGEVTFQSVTEPSENTVRLFVEGEQQDVKASNPAQCTPVPTPTSIPDSTQSSNITICHAVGNDRNRQYVTLELPYEAVYGTTGHLFEDGTTRHGHEHDYLGACETPTATSTGVAPTVTTHPTLTETVLPTETAQPTITTTLTATPTFTNTLVTPETLTPVPSATETATLTGTPTVSETATTAATATFTQTSVPTQPATATSTSEATVTETATTEPTAMQSIPSATPTPQIPSVDCQDGSSGRQDCSQLTVDASCQADGTPLFSIQNIGPSVSGDMVAPTEWRLYNSAGNLLTKGAVQLTAQEILEVSYGATGSYTLIVDQSTDYPGSQRQAQTLITCWSIPTSIPTTPSVTPTTTYTAPATIAVPTSTPVTPSPTLVTPTKPGQNGLPSHQGQFPNNPQLPQPNVEEMSGGSLLCDFNPTTTAELITDINTANANQQADIICLVQDGNYTVSAIDNGMNGLPIIASDITILGNNATLTRAWNAPLLRFIEINSTGLLTINNLTITNGHANYGGAIRNSGVLNLVDSDLMGNQADEDGGAIYHAGGSLSYNTGILYGNSADGRGGAIASTANLSLNSLILSTNTAGTAGGAIHFTGNQLTISASTFQSNSAATQGGALYSSGTQVTLTTGGMNTNQAGQTGGAIYQAGGTLSYSGGGLYGNSTPGHGGAIASTASLTLTSNIFGSNTAGNAGGAVYFSGTALTISTSAFENNNATTTGGALHLTTTANISGTSLTANSAGQGGAGIYFSGATLIFHNGGINSNTTSGSGAALYTSGTSVTITETSLNLNQAELHGGAIYQTSGSLSYISGLMYSNSADLTGGAIASSGSLSVESTTFDTNTAGSAGGGIHFSGSALTISASAFEENSAGTTGGALHSSTTATISGTSFSANTAAQNGGGIYFSGATLTFNNGGLLSNTSQGNGGGLYSSGTTVTLTNMGLNTNEAVQAGGAIYQASGSLSFSGGGMDGNSATGAGGAVASAGNLTLEGITLQNNTAGSTGGAVHFTGTTLAMGGGSTLLSNSAIDDGGAIYQAGGTATLGNISFVTNHSDQDGGAIYQASGSLDYFYGLINGNTAGGSGGAILGLGSLEFDYVTLRYNTAGTAGGAIHFAGEALTFTNGGFESNNAPDGGGALYTSGLNLTLGSSTFVTNTSPLRGGAIYQADGTLTYQNGLMNGNTTAGDGGAIYTLATTNLNTVQIQNSTSGNRGGAIYVTGSGSDLTLTASTLNNNSAVVSGGAVHNQGGQATFITSSLRYHTAPAGAALSNAGAGSQLTVVGGVIEHNTAAYGGGLDNGLDANATFTGVVFTSNQANAAGGALANRGGTVHVLESEFASNIAYQEGGAIYNTGTLLLETSTVQTSQASTHGGAVRNTGTATISGSQFLDNTAYGQGGGISNTLHLTIQDGTQLEDNWAASGGGIFVAETGSLVMHGGVIKSNQADYGGGLYIQGDATLDQQTLIELNHAYNSGGGLYATSSTSQVTLERVTFRSNTAAYVGGGLFNADGSTLSMTSGQIRSNTATYQGGGLYNTSQATLRGIKVFDNTAPNQGGGLFSTSSGQLEVQQSCIVGNTHTSVYTESSTSQNLTGNWWGAITGPSGAGPGTGDSISSNIDYADFLNVCVADLPADPSPTPPPTLPSDLTCYNWQESLAHGWISSTLTPGLLNWGTTGMVASADSSSGETLTMSAYYALPANGPWEIIFTTSPVSASYVVAQGAQAPTAGTLFSDVVALNENNGYSVALPFVQLQWNVTTPIDPAANPHFTRFCYRPIANQAPVIDAGVDRIIPSYTQTVALNSTVSDDGLPANQLNLTWSQVSGPGQATFSDLHMEDPTVQFSAAGVYVLRLTASDGVLSTSDTIEIAIATAPDLVVNSVDATGIIVDPQVLTLTGTVSAEIANVGSANLSRTFVITFFEDTNHNGTYEVQADNRLGMTARTGLNTGTPITVTTAVTGSTAFAGNLVYAFVDSQDVIVESEEANNLHSNIAECTPHTSTGPFNVALEWEWRGSPLYPSSHEVVATPVIADLNQDGIPDIVFQTYLDHDTHQANGRLRAISGDGSGELFTVTAFETRPDVSAAIGDIDLDGYPEIIALDETGQTVALEHDGTLKWRANVKGFAPSIADIDHDGLPEIVNGPTVINSDGSIRWDQWLMPGVFFDASPVVDLDQDGYMEIISGRVVFRYDGSVYWQAPASSQFNAVGNFNSDPFPEVVSVGNNTVYLLDHTGTVIWGPVQISTSNTSGGLRGGPPVIADLDGDGEPEIGVAGPDSYVAIETNGTIKWRKDIIDSSGYTGSSVFDFEGDGSTEIIYKDEYHLYIWRGIDGELLWSTFSTTRSVMEYPVVADVDADGNAEIIVATGNTHNRAYPTLQGIQVYGSPTDDWVAARQLWNQHSYHITNINDDLSIPVTETANWETYNNYRQNTYAGVCAFAQPDFVATFLRKVEDDLGIVVKARIGYVGNIDIQGTVLITFYDGQPGQPGTQALGTVPLTRSFTAGNYSDVQFRLPAGIEREYLWVVVDDDGNGQGEYSELSETNNQYHAALNLSPDLVVQAVDDSELQLNPNTLQATGIVTSQIKNQGPYPVTRTFKVIFFEDLNGNQQLDLADNMLATATHPGLDAGATQVVMAQVTSNLYFSNNIIYAMVDSDHQIPELNEYNNTGNTFPTCQLNSSATSLSASRLWRYNGLAASGSPVVADLDLDNTPEIVFVGLQRSGQSTYYFLTVLNGRTGITRFVQSNYQLSQFSRVAVANLDSDPELEIVTSLKSNLLIIFEHDGTPKPRLQDAGLTAQSIADIDRDGDPELATSNFVLDHLGRIVSFLTPSVALTDVVNLDMVGDPEILSGPQATYANNTLYWERAELRHPSDQYRFFDGSSAVANLDADPYPEIILVMYKTGMAYILEHDGKTRLAITLPGTGDRGGYPVVADFDGDGAAEFAITTSTAVTLYETDGTWKWSQPVSNNEISTGAAFDFAGDGSMELVVSDQVGIRIYRGSDGTVLWGAAHTINFTSSDNDLAPVIADVNADGHADIVVASDTAGLDQGISIYSNIDLPNDPANEVDWLPARTIWNQPTYHISNINENGSVPQYEVPSWLTHNTYRAQMYTRGCATGYYDLSASYARKGADGRTLTVRIGNGGDIFALPGVGVSFYDADPRQGGVLLGTVLTTQRLEPGDYEDVTITLSATAIANPVWVVANDPGNQHAQVAVLEPNADANNFYQTRSYVDDPLNTAPTVDAGTNQTIELPTNTVNLNGTTTDDNLPLGTMTYLWELQSGPTSVTIGTPNTLTTNVTFTQAGTYTLRLRVDDGEYMATDTVVITVNTPPTPPVNQADLIATDLIDTPDDEDVILTTKPLTLLADVSLRYVRVDYWQVNNPNGVQTWATNLTGTGGATIYQIDPTLLANDSYVIRVTGMNANDQWVADTVMIIVQGENKPGRVRFSVTDLVVPVTGLPITIGRTYDSLERNISSDFGYGWTLDIANPRVEVNAADDVTITMPDGRRVTFQFNPYAPAPLFPFYVPRYTPEPGVYGKLESDGCGLITISGGQYFCFPGGRYAASEFRYTDPYGRVFTMDAEGTLKSIVDLNDNTLTFTPEGITSSNGDLSVRFVRDAAGRITHILDPEGHTYQYHYDANGDLVRVDLPDTPAPTFYEYFAGHLFKSAIDPRGNRAVLTSYDSSGRLETVTDARGNVASYAYTLSATTTTVVTHHDSAGVLVGKEATMTNDAGYVIERRDYVTETVYRTTTYEYDANNNLLSETNNQGEKTRYAYNSNGHRTAVWDARPTPYGLPLITAAYNGYGGPTTLTDAQGNTTTISYDPFTYMPDSASDALGLLGEYEWDERGNPLTYANGEGEATTFTYDIYGNVTSRTNHAGETVSYTYDLLGRVETMTDPLGQTNPAGHTVTYTYDALGRVKNILDPAGEATTFTYDSNGNRTSITNRLGDATRYVYDASNNLTSIIYPDDTATDMDNPRVHLAYDWRGNLTSYEDVAGLVTVYEYNLAGQVTEMTEKGDKDENVLPSQWRVTTYLYDAAGRLEEVIDPLGSTQYEYDAAGNLTEMIDRTGASTVYEYNEASQLERVTDPLLRETAYAYDERGRLDLITYAAHTLDPDTTSYVYDLAGRRTTMTDEDGLVTEYAYDPAGRLEEERVGIGIPNVLPQVTRYAYDDAGRLTSQRDPMGYETTYAYDNLGRLTDVFDPLDNQTHYEYDDEGQLDWMADAEGHVTDYTYDEQGRLTFTDTPLSDSQRVYDTEGRLTRYFEHVNLPDRQLETRYTYTAFGELERVRVAPGTPIERETQYVYNQQGQRSAVILDPGGINAETTYTYDPMGRVEVVTDPLDRQTHYDYDAAGQLEAVTQGYHLLQAERLTTTYTYNERGWLHLTTSPSVNGQTIQTEQHYDPTGRLIDRFDALDRQTHYGYDAFGRLTSVTEAAHDLNHDRTTQYEYNANGWRTAVIDPRGNRTTYDYYETGWLKFTQDALQQGTTQKTSYTYDGRGLLETVTDAKNHITTYAYNDMGQLTRTIYPDNTFTENIYNPIGQLVAALDHSEQGPYGAQGSTTRYDYNLLGELTDVEAGYNTVDEAHTHYEYDALGRQIELLDPAGYSTFYEYNAASQLALEYTTLPAYGTTYAYDDFGRLASLTDANGMVTAFEYDALGRQVEQIFNPGANQTRIQNVYDPAGQLQTVIDQNNNETHYDYNPLGELSAVSKTGPNNTPNIWTVSYGYDAAGNLNRITNGADFDTLFVYDELNRVEEKIWSEALNLREFFTYDAVGNLTHHQLPGGTAYTNVYTYDTMDRLHTLSVFDGQTFTYDYTLNGQLETVQDTRGTTTYTYDHLDRITQVDNPGAGDVGYTYNLDGSRASMTTPAGTVSYTYNNRNLLETVSQPGPGTVTYTYDEAGLRDTLLYPNGMVADYDYDAQNRLTHLIYQDSTQQTLASYEYTLDDVGNRTRVDEHDGSYTTWTYDAAYRLTAEQIYDPTSTLLAHTEFTYDAAGNRLTETDVLTNQTTLYGYDDYGQDRLTDVTLPNGDQVNYSYDLRGNMTGISASSGSTITATTTYEYDGLDRLTEATLPDGTEIDYTYDHDGRRVQQNIQPTVGLPDTTHYLWDELSTYGDVILETDGTHAPVASYLLGAGGHILAQQRASTTHYYLTDGQHSVRALVNSAGALTDTYDYTAYGELYAQTGSTQNNYLYTGQQFDDLTGLYSLRARYYAPDLGRFTSKDTYAYNYQNPIELNRYGYAQNNPANYTDPTGYNSLGEFSLVDFTVSAAQGGVRGGIFGGTLRFAVAGVSLLFAGAGMCGDRYKDQLSSFTSIIGFLFEQFAIGYVTGFAVGAAFGAAGYVTGGAVGGYTEAVLDGIFLGVDAHAAIKNKKFTLCDAAAMLIDVVAGLGTVGGSSYDSSPSSNGAFSNAGGSYGNSPNTSTAPSSGGFNGSTTGSGSTGSTSNNSNSGNTGNSGNSSSNSSTNGSSGGHNGNPDVDGLPNNSDLPPDTTVDDPNMDGIDGRNSEEEEWRSHVNACSFTEDTPVATEDGYIAIRDLEIGDTVLAYNEETGETASYPITAIHIHLDEEITYLVIDGEMIVTTPDHPFYREDGEWMGAGDLEVGEGIRRADGSYGIVESVITVQQEQEMYNLTVEVAHTFFVGENQWLVHNTCDIKQVPYDPRANQLRNHHNLPAYPEGNVGFGDYYDKDGNLVHSISAIAGWHQPGQNPYPGTADLLPKPQRLFDTLMHTQAYPDSTPRHDFDRAVDAEAKILEYFAHIFTSDQTGTVVLYTERVPCPSCGGNDGISGVIGQFQDMFPNINVEVRHTYP